MTATTRATSAALTSTSVMVRVVCSREVYGLLSVTATSRSGAAAAEYQRSLTVATARAERPGSRFCPAPPEPSG